jgi:hypothetical protein
MKKTMIPFLTTLALLIIVVFGSARTNSAEREAARVDPQGPQGPAIDSPGRKLKALSLARAAIIGGNPISGTVRLEFVAPLGGTRVSLTSDPPFNPEGGNAAFVPTSVTVPQGEATANFEIRTFPVQFSRQVTVRATAGGVTKTASFSVEPVQVAGFVVAPTFGVGPFEVRASVTLNAPAVEQTDVTLASTNPNVVGFGLLGTLPTRTLRFERGERSLTGVPMYARSVQEITTLTITASLNGSTQSRPMRIEPR